MKIYTRTGDSGETSLLGGTRVKKSQMRIHAYGTVDELNSYIGLVADQEVNQTRSGIFNEIQDCLFTIGSLLAVEKGTRINLPKIEEEDINKLESLIDEMDSELPEMKNFVLPGGHISVSHTHVCRSICRRAERWVTALNEQDTVDPLIVKYLNRLSDFLFILSRKIAQELRVEEKPWKPRK